MNSNLKDKVVLITGATGGIGKEVAKAFASEGSKIALTSRTQEKLDALVAELGVPEDHVATFVVDVSKEEEVKAAVDGAIAKWGSLDVLVNNSGDNGSYKPIAELTREDFLAVYDINVFGVMYGMKYAVAQMIQWVWRSRIRNGQEIYSIDGPVFLAAGVSAGKLYYVLK